MLLDYKGIVLDIVDLLILILIMFLKLTLLSP